jgi:hypothetical protein
MMRISPVKKSEFLRSISAKRLKGVSLAIVQIIVERINATLGIAFANYSKYADEAGRDRQVAERTIPALCRHGVLKKRARRNGPPVLWFPELMDMDPAEAVRRVEWYVRHQDEDPSAYFPGGYVKNDEPSPVGYVKNDGSGYVKNDVHNTISNNLSLRERAPQQLRAKGNVQRGTRLPHDWAPSQTDRELAKRHGLSDSQIDIQGTKFRNYWTSKPGKAACKLSWSRTWENWVITAAEGRKPAQKTAEVRLSEPPPDPRTFTHEDWRNIRDVMLKHPGSKWPKDHWGPPPGCPDCLMPEPLQLELGLNGGGGKAAGAA